MMYSNNVSAGVIIEFRLKKGGVKRWFEANVWKPPDLVAEPNILG